MGLNALLEAVAVNSVGASGRMSSNPRVRTGEISDPQARGLRQAACQNAIMADGRPQHGQVLPHPR